MEAKKKRGVEPPPRVKAFITSVVSTPLDNIDVPLRRFSWKYGKGDLSHWEKIFYHFEVFFEHHVKSRADLHLEGEVLERGGALPKEAVLQVLRVTRLIYINCRNVSERAEGIGGIGGILGGLWLLYASRDPNIVFAALKVSAAVFEKRLSRHLDRQGWHFDRQRWHIDTLSSRLLSLSQGWGGKEGGLGLLTCAQDEGCDANMCKLGATLHFEFCAESDSSSLHGETNTSGLKVIHIPDLHLRQEGDLELLKQFVNQYRVPSDKRFALLTRIRCAQGFVNFETRRQYIRMRLHAYIVLSRLSYQCSLIWEDLTATSFISELEFVDELVTVLRYTDTVPEEIRLLAIFALAAHSRARPWSGPSNVFNVIDRDYHWNTLPRLLQKAIESITEGSSGYSVAFVEGLLSVVTDLASCPFGSFPLREAIWIPILLPLLKDMDPQHTHLVTAALLIVKGFNGRDPTAGILFGDLDGLGVTVTRLKVEVTRVAQGAKFEREESKPISEGRVELGYEDVDSLSSQGTGHQRLLLKTLLSVIARYSTTLLILEESDDLMRSLAIIFRYAKEFGGAVFSLAASVMTALMRDNRLLGYTFNSSGIAFLDAIQVGVLPSSKAVRCIPSSLLALCSSPSGCPEILERNALSCFVKIFTSKVYIRALANDMPFALGLGLRELLIGQILLIRAAESMCSKILKTIAAIGSSLDSISVDAPEPVDTDVEDRSSATPTPDNLPGASVSLYQPQDPGDDSDLETFLPMCMSNALRLLERVLGVVEDTFKSVVVKDLLGFYTLPHLPVSFGDSVAARNMFRIFRVCCRDVYFLSSVCDALQKHLQVTVDQLKLSDLHSDGSNEVFRSLLAVECYLSLSVHLAEISDVDAIGMMTELSRAAEALSNVGTVHREVLWQIAQIDDAKVESKEEAEGGCRNRVAKSKSPESMIYDMMTRLAEAARGLYKVWGKTMLTQLRSDDTAAVYWSQPKLFLEDLSFSGHGDASQGELHKSIKCRYLGKVVEDVLAVVFDSRQRTCNTVLFQTLFSHGAMKELLKTFAATSQLLWTLPQSSGGSPMENENEKSKAEKSEEKAVANSWLLDALLNYARLMKHLVTSSLLLPPASLTQLLTQPDTGVSKTLAKVPEAFVRSLQAQVLEVVLPVWSHPRFAECSATFITSMATIITNIYTGGDGPSKEESTLNTQDKESAVDHEVSQVPSAEEMLLTFMNRPHNAEAVAFPLKDLLVSMCKRNKGQDRTQVICNLVRQLKSCKVDGSMTDTCPLSTISHTLALVLSEDSRAQEIAAENGVVSVALDVLEQFRPVKTSLKNEIPKWLTALLLVLDHMLVYKLKITSDQPSGSATVATASNSIGVSSDTLALVRFYEALKETAASPFVSVPEKPSGYMSEETSYSKLWEFCSLPK